jgi:hypothetical protein
MDHGLTIRQWTFNLGDTVTRNHTVYRLIDHEGDTGMFVPEVEGELVNGGMIEWWPLDRMALTNLQVRKIEVIR